MEKICAREECKHSQKEHFKGKHYWKQCETEDCQCSSFILPIRPPRNKDFPGENLKIILGKHEPATDLGASRDELLKGCLITLMRLCKHINVKPHPVVKKAAVAIDRTCRHMADYCDGCQLQWGQAYGHRGELGHLYGCEVARRRQTELEKK